MLGSFVDNANLKTGKAYESTIERLSIASSDLKESSNNVHNHHR